MDFFHTFNTSITVLHLTVTFRKNVTATKIGGNLDIVSSHSLIAT